MRQQSQDTYHEEVRVRQDLVGLAIGSHGNNIQTAKRLPGITSIELEETSSTFHISGEVCVYVYTAAFVVYFNMMNKYCADLYELTFKTLKRWVCFCCRMKKLLKKQRVCLISVRTLFKFLAISLVCIVFIYM